jgi:colanic acid/amylovoran biosynthesis protein
VTNILIDKVNTLNKGAELMAVAVLQEIERRCPGTTVYFHELYFPQGISHIPTKLRTRLSRTPFLFKLLAKLRVPGILRRLFGILIPYYSNGYPVKGLDLVLDAGGFQFSDQCLLYDSSVQHFKRYVGVLKRQGTRIVYLPQAYGPFETTRSKKILEILDANAECIIAREESSYNYLIKAGIKKDIWVYPDFTALVDGIVPPRYIHLCGGIAIIPNMRMVDRDALAMRQYIDILAEIIMLCINSDKTPFLLNHEGKHDFALCLRIKQKLGNAVPVVTDVNALEIKGILSRCSTVISSRYHGCVSALASGVPCLATAWSHKYEMLFRDFGMDGMLLDFHNKEETFTKVRNILDEKRNGEIREQLNRAIPRIKEKNREMWDRVWERLSM